MKKSTHKVPMAQERLSMMLSLIESMYNGDGVIGDEIEEHLILCFNSFYYEGVNKGITAMTQQYKDGREKNKKTTLQCKPS